MLEQNCAYNASIQQSPLTFIAFLLSSLNPATLSWSIFTLLTPFAAKYSIFSLVLCRFCLGISEGPALPSAHSLISAWIPHQEQSRAVSTIIALAYCGSIVALPASTFLGSSVLGWESIFYVFSGVGIAWCVIWYVYGGNSPESEEQYLRIEEDEDESGNEDEWGNEDESRDVNEIGVVVGNEENRVNRRVSKVGDIPWKIILSRKEVWAIVISQVGTMWGFFVIENWLPTYYLERFGVDVSKLGYYSGKCVNIFKIHRL
jgi:MFS transporter, ACS family, solute carrier family 17 (sodium-dependent inorganic phosphate cotransporter), other